MIASRATQQVPATGTAFDQYRSGSPSQIQTPAQKASTETSMEEILASIRRIIADDSAVAPIRASIPSPPMSRSEDNAPQPRLVRPVPAPGIAASGIQAEPAQGRTPLPGFGARNASPDINGPRFALPDTPLRQADTTFDSILRDRRPGNTRTETARPNDTRTAADSGANHGQRPGDRFSLPRPPLGQPLDQNSNIVSQSTGASVSSAFGTLSANLHPPTPEMIEQTTRDLLRPMLKSWLDDNLPVIVERLVRTEIERVARGPKQA